jgi:hypothetical protein
MAVSKGSLDACSLPGFGLDNEIALAAAGCLQEQGKPQSNVPCVPRCIKGIQDSLANFFAHAPSIVDNLDHEKVGVFVFFNANLNAGCPCLHGILNDIQNME